MQHKLSPNDTPPTQDLAISCLLEIDLRDSQDLPNWADQKKLIQLGNKQRLKHPTRIQPAKPKIAANSNHKKQDDSPPLKRSYNPEMLQNNKSQQNAMDEAANAEREHKSRDNKQKKFNEGEFWSSKVNWISQGTRQQVRSQPKLSKKFSFRHEVNFRQTCRGNSRYDLDEKNKQQKYKTNLIYSILSGETEAVRFRYLEQKSQMISSKSFESSPSANINKKEACKQDSKAKGQSCNSTISKNLQDSMRRTLKKINARNYQDDPILNQNPNNKPSEMERAALVRQMLQNIELAKDKSSVSEPRQDKKVRVEAKHQQIVQDIMQPFVYGTEELKPKSKVLNLNLQAEKIYKGKTVTRWNGRRIIQVLKIQ